jgi:hypothetical protein
MSLIGTLVTDFKNEAVKVKSFLQKLEGEVPTIVADVTADEAKLVPVIEAFIPGSTKAIAVADDVFNKIAQAVEDAGEAAGSSGLSVLLDQTVVADVKAVITAAKAKAGVKA